MSLKRLSLLLLSFLMVILLNACNQSAVITDLPDDEGIEWNGGTYAGELSYALPHGYGKWVHPSGGQYEGDWEYGLKSGYGRLVTADGDIYAGYWADDLLHGFGKYIGIAGEYYEGEWVEGLYHGQGIWRSSSGEEFRGTFLDGHYRQEELPIDPGEEKEAVYISSGEEADGSTSSEQDEESTRQMPVQEEAVGLVEVAASSSADNSVSVQVSDLLSSHFKVTGLRFFSSGSSPGGYSSRNYSTSFNSTSNLYIYWELELFFFNPELAREFQLTSSIRPTGGNSTMQVTVPPGDETYRVIGPKTQKYHKLAPGKYDVTIRLGGSTGRVIASGSFDVY